MSYAYTFVLKLLLCNLNLYRHIHKTFTLRPDDDVVDDNDDDDDNNTSA